jgi:carboxymethylenebutenolidase
MGEMIEFAANGGKARGYLAVPAPDASNGKGVVVIQEWWGLVPHIKDVADRFAAAGFIALAPDLYGGETTTDPDDAGRRLVALEIDKTEKDLRGAIAALKDKGGVSGRVGVVGFCMGGQLALLAATTNPDGVGAAVDFYGIHPNVKPDFSKLSCPVLGLFAEKDQFVTAEAARELAGEIEKAGGKMEMEIYPGVDHAFFNDTRPDVYDQKTAETAWKRTLAFLEAKL